MNRLLGIDGELREAARAWTINFAGAWPLWVILFAGIAMIVLIVRLYRAEKPGLSRRDVVVFALLRLTALALVLLMLFHPVLTWEIPEERQSTLLIILDDSQSMAVPDRYDGSDQLPHVVRALWGRELKDWTGTDESRLSAAQRAELAGLTRAELVNRVLATGERKALADLAREFEIEIYLASESLRGVSLDGGAEGPRQRVEAVREATITVEPQGAVTRLGDLVREAVNRHRGQVAAVALVSDGMVNAGEDLESLGRFLARREIRTYCVGVGDQRLPRDLRLTAAEANRVALQGDLVPVDVDLESVGYRGETVEVRLERDGSPVTVLDGGRETRTTTVTLEEETMEVDGRRVPKPQRVRLVFRADEEGAFTYSVVVEPRAEELVRDNNRMDIPVRVLREKMKVLYVEGLPRWEYRYLKTILTRDDTVDVSCLLSSADFEFSQEGDLPISYFPNKSEELFAYDVVLLGDVPRSQLTDAQLRDLVKFVEVVGGGLMMIAGEHCAPREYRGTSLERILPVDLDPTGLGLEGAGRHERVQSWRPVLTPEGELHPQTRFLGDIEANKRLWAGLPGFFWHYPITRAKPGATVLLVHPFARSGYGPEPLLTVQHYGSGKVGFLATDETWRWRDRADDRYMGRFWGQVVRDLSQNKLMGKSKRFRVSSAKTKYRLGEKVELYARILDANYEPLRSRDVEVKVECEGTDPVTLRLAGREEEGGEFRGEFLPRRTGKYRVTLTVSETGLPEEAITHEFLVAPSTLEYQDARMNRAGLEKLARTTEGRLFDVDQTDELARSILHLKADAVREVSDDVWNAPLFFAGFAGLFVTELWYRKRKKLL